MRTITFTDYTVWTLADVIKAVEAEPGLCALHFYRINLSTTTPERCLLGVMLDYDSAYHSKRHWLNGTVTALIGQDPTILNDNCVPLWASAIERKAAVLAYLRNRLAEEQTNE